MNKQIIFSDEIEDGSNEAYFCLGFTSLTILKNINNFDNKSFFNIYCTYKLLKYSFPQIALVLLT